MTRIGSIHRLLMHRVFGLGESIPTASRNIVSVLIMGIALVFPVNALSLTLESRGEPIIQPARRPVFVDVEFTVEDVMSDDRFRRSEVIFDAVDVIGAAHREENSRLVTLRLVNAPLAWEPEGGVETEEQRLEQRNYEVRLAELLDAILNKARSQHTGVALSVLGLPLEIGSPSQILRINERFHTVMDQFDAFVAGKAMILDGNEVSEGTALSRGNPNAVRSANERKRPVVFRTNGRWRVRGASAGNNDSSNRLALPSSPNSDDIKIASDSVVKQDSGSGSGGGSNNGGGTGGTGGGGGGGTTYDGNTPVIKPGNGWNGETAQPNAVGNPGQDGYDAMAIARWDVVPYRAFDAKYQIGVVAFHMNDIDRVEFAVDGGEWVAVEHMTLNPRTDVWEYSVVLDPADFSNQAIEVRAIAYPKVGEPRVLESMPLYAQPLAEEADFVYVSQHGDDAFGNGSRQAPYRNLWRAAATLRDRGSGDGTFIYCLPGEYEWYQPTGYTPVETENRWLTVAAAPGIERKDVHIIGYTVDNPRNGLNTKLLRFHNVTFSGTTLSLMAAANQERYLFVDSCFITGESKYWTFGWYDGIYVLDTLANDVDDHAIIATDLIRNCEVTRFSGDAYKGGRCVINSKVSHQLSASSVHSDVWQDAMGHNDNIIIYGVTAVEAMDEQGIFSRAPEHNDVAIVNCDFYLTGYPAQNQWHTLTHHWVVRYNTFKGAPFRIGLSNVKPTVPGFLGSTNGRWEYNIIQWLYFMDPENVLNGEDPGYEHISGEVKFDHNHFFNEHPDYSDRAGTPVGESVGTNTTTGDVIPAGVGAYGSGQPPWVGLANQTDL